jgi:hypothetical protein
MKFIASSVGHREIAVTITHAGEICGQVCQLVGHEVDNFALALNAALHGDHAGGEDDAALAFVE